MAERFRSAHVRRLLGRVRARLAKESRIRGAAHDLEALKRVYDRELAESGADFLFYTRLADVVAEDGEIKYAVCAAPSGMWAVKARVYVDARR